MDSTRFWQDCVLSYIYTNGCHYPTGCHEGTLSVVMSNTVHIYCANLGQLQTQLEQLYQTLSPDEMQRACRFHFDQDRHNFMTSRGLLRKLLAAHLHIEAQRIQFCYNPYGKPELAPPFHESKLSFNVAHSGDWALYAITYQRRIGIDIERIRPEIDYENLALHVFSNAEQQMLQLVLPAQRVKAFYNGWALKEAYIKAQGMGLSLPLDQFTISLSPEQPARLVSTEHSPEQAALWSMQALTSIAGYAAALVAEGHNWQMCWHEVVT